MPRWLLGGVLIALLLVGLFAPGPWSSLPLFVLGAFLGWLLFLSWPAIGAGGRVARSLAVLAVLGAGVYKLVA